MITGSGIDIIEIERIRKAIERWGDHFLNHIFCMEEIEYAQKHKDPFQHFAARFAAKEAIIKALNLDAPVLWKDIKILNNHNGKPFCLLDKKDFKDRILISISHTKNYAVASAIITSQSSSS